MRDLRPYIIRCCRKLDDLKIAYASDITFDINYRAKTRLGQCKRKGDSYIVEIASSLLDEQTPESLLIETLMHEILHTCDGCMKHTGKWKQYADKVNAAYGYNITRTAGREELPENISADLKPKYRVVCKSCGAVYERFKQSAVIKHPERYRCGKCGKPLR